MRKTSQLWAMVSTKAYWCFWQHHMSWLALRVYFFTNTSADKNMENKRQGFVPFIACKCPKCGKGKVFKNSIFSTKFAETNYSCTVCKMSYEPEPGFFYGAMYFSYALIVGLIITGSVVFYSIDLFDYAIVGIPTLIVTMVPLIFRYSRMLMLYVVYPAMYKEKFYHNPSWISLMLLKRPQSRGSYVAN